MNSMPVDHSAARLAARNWTLILGVCVLQLVVILVPALSASFGISALVVLFALLAAAVASSVSNTILFLIFVSSVIPNPISQEHLLLPMGFKFSEGVFLVVLFLVLLTGLLSQRSAQPTALDRPVTVFLLLVGFSCAVGLYYGQSTSQMLRDVRYPCYYLLFFVVTRFYPTRRSRTFFNVLVLVSAIVGIEYLFEFFSSVNLSITGQFERVARPAGLLLMIGTLLVGSVWLYGREGNARLVSGIALIPISLAFILTVGRGMWISAIAGLMALGFLYYKDRRREGLRGLALIAAVPVVVLVVGSVFQSATETGVGSMAVRRLARIQTYEQDHSISGRLLSYQTAVTKIIGRPIIGAGHGVTVDFYDWHATTPGVSKLGAVDNVYLTLLLRMGVIGLAAFLWIYIRGLKIAYRLFQASEAIDTRLFAAAFFTVYTAMLVYGMADPTMMTTRLILIHAASLGILATLAREARL